MSTALGLAVLGRLRGHLPPGPRAPGPRPARGPGRPAAAERLPGEGRPLAAAAAAGDAEAGAEGAAVLVRDFVHGALYDERAGYFVAKAGAVGELAEPLDFGSMVGRDGYMRKVREAYEAIGVSWLTPAAIFDPHYAHAVARYFLEAHRSRVQGEGLKIYEVGGGTGAVARSILDFVRQEDPEAYEAMQYRVIEISAALAERQLAKVREGGAEHLRVFDVWHGDASSPASWESFGGLSDETCFVFGLEVLDNMPHDLVRCTDQGEFEEATVAPGAGGKPTERWRPLQDPLVRECLAAYDWYNEEQQRGPISAAEAEGGGLMGSMLDFIEGTGAGGLTQRLWLPTRSLEFFRCVHRMRPNHQLLLADFDALPDVRVDGINAPLVADTRGAAGRDYRTYLLPYGTADIFFPTNFDALCKLYDACIPGAGGGGGGGAGGAAAGKAAQKGGGATHHISTAEFMEVYADMACTRTVGGYEPLLEDYQNTRIFIAGTEAPFLHGLVRVDGC